MYRAFGVNYTKTQGLLQPLTAAEVMEQTKEFTRNALTMKQPEKPLGIKSIFPKKPTIGR
jgi:hypothetical protein